jgi:hypothetical protein
VNSFQVSLCDRVHESGEEVLEHILGVLGKSFDASFRHKGAAGLVCNTQLDKLIDKPSKPARGPIDQIFYAILVQDGTFESIHC